MKSFLAFVLFSATASLSFAAPLTDYLGIYKYSEADLNLQQIQHVISLRSLNEEARRYVRELIGSGYQCTLTAGINKCKKFDLTIPENLELRQSLNEENRQKVLNFEPSQFEYELVNDAPVLQEFEKNQKSSFDNNFFNKVHLYLTSGLTKIKLFSTDNEDQAHFYINSKGFIAQQVSAMSSNAKQNSFVIEDKNIYLYETIWTQ